MSTNSIGELWDHRFASVRQNFLYGTTPNVWIASRLPVLDVHAKVLALADGEGRNTVWLAHQGYNASNWDYSLVGLNKTKQLATDHGLSVHTRHIDLTSSHFKPNQFDAIVSSFFHVSKEHQLNVWHDISQMLKPNGHLIVQVFAESQLGRDSGGPKDIDLLYQKELFLQALTPNFKILELTETETLLDEGSLHQGLAKVINLHAVKNFIVSELSVS